MADDSSTTQASDAPAQTEQGAADVGDDERLSEAGVKALEAFKARAREAEKKAKQSAQQAAQFEARLAEIEQANLSETEKAIAQARDEARAEATSEANRRILRSEVKVVAADKLQDPADALALLDLEEFDVDNDGNVDTKAIEAAIAKLVEAKPYLSKDATSRGPQGTGGGGARPQPLPLNGDPLLNTLKNKLGINQ